MVEAFSPYSGRKDTKIHVSLSVKTLYNILKYGSSKA